MGIVPEGNIFLTEPTESFYIECLEKGISDAAYIMALDCFAGRENGGGRIGAIT